MVSDLIGHPKVAQPLQQCSGGNSPGLTAATAVMEQGHGSRRRRQRKEEWKEGTREGGGRQEGRKAGRHAHEGRRSRERSESVGGGRERESGLRNRESEREATTKHLGALRKVSIIMRNCF